MPRATVPLLLAALLAGCGGGDGGPSLSFPYPTDDAGVDGGGRGPGDDGGAACTPSCQHRNCGDDGCGGSCGTCPAGEECWPDGQCRLEGCVTACGGRECGDDGCGGQCGFCGAGESCQEGACAVIPCTPACAGKGCGPDGCGGSCGDCAEGEVCGEDGLCRPEGCVPDCDGRECGPDACGGSCGACGPDGLCDAETGRCVCQPDCTGKECGNDGCGGSCGGCPPGFECDQNNTCWESGCIPDCEGRECGSDGCSGTCGTCPAGVTCTAAGQCLCVPKCEGKDCGGDGCGGVCGTCPAGQVCLTGLCKPDPCGIETCADIGGPAACCGDVLYKCGGGGQVMVQDCAEEGRICAWHPYLLKYICLDPGCQPACDGLECGPDGCGAACGSCGPGYLCKDGACAGTGWTSCNDFDGTGACSGDLLYTCTGGLSVSVYDCELLGKSCKESVVDGVPTAACK